MRGDPPLSVSIRIDKNASTPHARGSTLSAHTSHVCPGVYPACAGIHLPGKTAERRRDSLPRMRGDPPDSDKPGIIEEASTPHARGSTWTSRGIQPERSVYPACAGIHPT